MLREITFKIKKFFKRVEKKPEEEKMQMMWFLIILCMLGIFLLWIATVSRNFTNLANHKMDLSGLPQYPKTDNIDLGKTLRQGKDALDEYEQKNKEQLQQIGDKYIADNKILSDDSFSSLRFKDAKEDGDAILLNYEQYYKDIPVLEGNLILSVNPQNNQVSETQNNLKKGISLSVDPIISAKDAQAAAQKKIDDPSHIFSEAKLAIIQQDEKFYLVWKTIFNSAEKGDGKEVLVGAKYGGVIDNQ